jgi:hypothetical protein
MRARAGAAFAPAARDRGSGRWADDLASSSFAPSLTHQAGEELGLERRSTGRGCQTVDSLRSPMYFSSMPRWLM